MTINIDYYKYLLTVEDCGSIRQAAELLHMKQQNLSSMIRNIERYYDIIIFDRSPKGVQVTADGAFFLKEARALLAIADRMESPYLYPSKQYYSQIVDSINIYFTSVIGSHNLVEIINRFREYFPYVNVNLLTKSREGIIEAQRQDEKSVGILVTVDSLEQVEAAVTDDIIVVPFVRTPLYAATAKDNPEGQHITSISVYDLLKKKLILLSQTESKDTFVYELLSKFGTPSIQHTVDNAAIFIELLKQNNLWAICVAEQAQQNNLRAIPFQEDCRAQAYIIYHKKAKEDIVLTSLLKILANYGR